MHEEASNCMLRVTGLFPGLECGGLAHDEIITRAQRVVVECLGPLEISTQYGRVAAVEVISEDFEIGDRFAATIDAMKSRRPEGVVYCFRIGEDYLYRLGEPSWRSKTP
jgi:hypothetical protein